MKWSAILESVAYAGVSTAAEDLDLYRKDVLIAAGDSRERLRLSVLDLSPAQPEETIVLVHGFAASNIWWNAQLMPLARRYRVIAPDFRGHGRSEHAAGGYTIVQMADDLAAILDALEITRPVVMAAHSAGGFIITEFALRYPQRVSLLALIATPLEMDQKGLPFFARLAMNLPDFCYPIAQPFYELDPKGRGTAYLLGLHRLFQDMVRWNGKERFPKLTQPVMLIHGERDYIFSESTYSRLAELIPQAESVNIGASKHQVPLERPKALLRSIERFINTSTGKPSAEPDWRAENDAINSVRLVSERPWVVHYEQGVPLNLDIPNVSFYRLVNHAIEAFPRRTALRFRSQGLTYRQVGDEVERFATLLAHFGIQKGDRILLHLPNLPHFVIAFLGALRQGVVVVMESPETSLEQLVEHTLLVQPALVVTTEAQKEVAQILCQHAGVPHLLIAKEADYDLSKARQDHKEARKHGEALVSTLPPADAPEIEWCRCLGARFIDQAVSTTPMPGLSPSDAAVISFTSGTVSASKAVLLSHHNLVANALQLSAWFSNLGSKASILCGIPLANLFGLTFGVNLAVRSGACMILEPSRSPDTLLQSIQANDPTIFVTVPVVLQALANQPGIGARFSHAVRYCVTGTAPLPVEVREAFERLTHSQIIESYGLCETTQTTHINSLQAARTGSIGLPLPGTQSRIVDLVNGQILPFGQIGELVLRGPQVFKGYWQASGSLQLLSETDGWLQTGDVARMDDDGYFFLLGSRSEMWLGEDGGLIFPRDAEEVIYEIPGVNEVAVVPVQNMPVAFISQDAGSKLRAETIYEFCQRRLPAMQIPQKIFFVDALPRTNSGKILRGELHDQANRLVQ